MKDNGAQRYRRKLKNRVTLLGVAGTAIYVAIEFAPGIGGTIDFALILAVVAMLAFVLVAVLSSHYDKERKDALEREVLLVDDGLVVRQPAYESIIKFSDVERFERITTGSALTGVLLHMKAGYGVLLDGLASPAEVANHIESCLTDGRGAAEQK